jgi:hypothetical protein
MSTSNKAYLQTILVDIKGELTSLEQTVSKLSVKVKYLENEELNRDTITQTQRVRGILELTHTEAQRITSLMPENPCSTKIDKQSQPDNVIYHGKVELDFKRFFPLGIDRDNLLKYKTFTVKVALENGGQICQSIRTQVWAGLCGSSCYHTTDDFITLGNIVDSDGKSTLVNIGKHNCDTQSLLINIDTRCSATIAIWGDTPLM